MTAPLAKIKRSLFRLIGRQPGGDAAQQQQMERAATVAEMLSCDSHFDEHHLFLDDLVKRYPSSNISFEHPSKSSGTPRS